MAEWLFDLGNSRLKCAPLRPDGTPGEGFAIAHDGRTLPADWARELPVRLESIALASVVSDPLRAALLAGLAGRCGRVARVRTEPAFGGLRIAYPQPGRLGVDRFLALLGAWQRGRGPWLVVGVGTATTLDLLDAQGLHRGGRIAPSPTLMREALHWRAPHLSATGGRYVAFADDTDDALASGCLGAARALVLCGLEDAVALLGARPHLLVHGGGGAALLESGLPEAVAAPHLVMEGLARWARSQG